MGKVREHQIIALSTKINVICESNCTGIQNFWASGASRNACTLPPLGKPTVGISRKKILCKAAVFERTGTNTWPSQCAKTSFFKGRNGHFYFVIQNLFVETVAFQNHAPICSETNGLYWGHWHHCFVKIWMMFCLLLLQDWKFLTHSRSFACFTSPSFFFWKKKLLYTSSSSHMKGLGCDSDVSGSPHLCA